MPYFVVGCCVPLAQAPNNCVVVQAALPEAAAVEGIGVIEDREGDDLDPDYCDTVFVAPINMDESVTFERTTGVKRAPEEYQCCGGTGYTPDGHSGHCPSRKAAAE